MAVALFTSAPPHVPGFDTAAADVLRFLQDRLGMEMVSVARRDREDYVVLQAVDSAFGTEAGDILPWGDTFCARMVDGTAPEVAPVVDEVPAFVEARTALGLEGVQSYVTVPMLGDDGRLLGTVCAAGRHRRDDTLLAEREVVELCASLLGALLSKELRSEYEARRAEVAEDAALTDPLTGLGNRRRWEHALDSEEERCRRYGIPAAVLALDVDSLKHINDTRGHDGGDGVLRAVANVITATVRSHDQVARVGGDEFTVLLPECEPEEAAAVAERLGAALDAAGVGCSVGVAVRSARSTVHAAWQAADAHMYVVKAARARSERPVTTPSVLALDPDTAAGIEDLLASAREHLGMPLAFVTQFVGDQRVMRHISAPVPIDAGQSEPLEGTYCQRIVDGRLPEVIPDTLANPEAAAIEATSLLGMGSYVGVPVRLSDGRLYGTLCCVGFEADNTLNARDASFLRVISHSVATQLERAEGHSEKRREILRRVDEVLEAGGPTLVYQPIVDLATGRVAGAEVLSRFPAHQQRTPDVWFAEAASVGSTVDVELSVLRRAVEVLGELPGRVAVNLSTDTLCSAPLLAVLATLPVERITIEVSEHEEITDYAELLGAITPLRARGLQIAVDDAGAGFASMRHILLLRPDTIKLDISLVRDIHEDAAKQALASSLATFASRTGARVVAEGIETAAELDALVQLGVGFGQGYHLGRPAPWEQLAERLAGEAASGH